MVGRKKKGDGTIQSANPDFGCARVKVQDALFVHFEGRIGRGNNLNADLRSPGEELRIFIDLQAVGSEPGDVDRLDAISSGERALRQGSTLGQKLIQKMDNVTLATRVSESWRRAHEDVSMAIGLNPIRKLRENWIRQDFGPTVAVEPGLRKALRKFNGERHRDKYAGNGKK